MSDGSLLEELGLDEEDFEWKHLSLCRDITITGPSDDVFFDAYEASVETAKAVDEMCLHCPVLSQCFFAGSEGQYGVWGGIYWNGSGKPDKNKNSHKNDETWDEIRSRVSE